MIIRLKDSRDFSEPLPLPFPSRARPSAYLYRHVSSSDAVWRAHLAPQAAAARRPRAPLSRRATHCLACCGTWTAPRPSRVSRQRPPPGIRLRVLPSGLFRAAPLSNGAMASSPSQPPRAARAALPPDDPFFSLVDKIIHAGVLCRYARVVELSSRCAEKGEALHGDDSLVVAHLRVYESGALANMTATARGAESAALFRRSWSALLSVIAILQLRLATNTLLPGTVRKEESDYYTHDLSARFAALNKPVPTLAELQTTAPSIGYIVLVDALCRSLNFTMASFHPMWPVGQRKVVESFVRARWSYPPLYLSTDARGGALLQVLQALDVISQTAGIECKLGAEFNLVAFIENVSPQKYDPAFCAAVLRRWRSDAVRSVLRARGVLQTGTAFHEQTSAEFDDRQREDIAKHGLRVCALPSCSKTETTVKEFAHCSGCRSVVYCCAEHQGLHWTKHKKACREKEAARLAAEEGGGDATSAGAAAAGMSPEP